jgi:hypothetical protein
MHLLTQPPSELPEFNRENLVSLEKGLQFLQYKLMRKVEETGMKMLELKNEKKKLMEIWNNAQVFLGREVAVTFGDIALLTVMREGIAEVKNAQNRELLETVTRLWLLRLYRNDEFVDMVHHPLIEGLMDEDCSKLEGWSLELLRRISPDDSVTGSPFSDSHGRGMEKYLEQIFKKPTNQRPEWW